MTPAARDPAQTLAAFERAVAEYRRLVAVAQALIPRRPVPPPPPEKSA
jgi:hypothetical protein